MKRWLFTLVLACTSPHAPEHANHRLPPGKIQHVIVVSVDGLMPAAYLEPDAHGLAVPTLRKLAASGARAVDGMSSAFPTVTYPSHTSMVTGVWPARHGIYTNRPLDPKDEDLGGWRWYAEDIQHETIWRLAERAGYPVAMVWWPVTVGADVTWRAPEYWRARDDNDRKLERALATPGWLEAVARDTPDFWKRFGPPDVDDSALMDITTHVIEHHQPTLLFVHLVEVDKMQHDFGVWSPEARAAIEKEDGLLAKLTATIAKSGHAGDTSLVVLSDHGFLDAPRMVEPCVTLRDAGLVTTGAGGHVSSWRVAMNNSGGEAYFYLAEAEPPSTLETLRSALDGKEGIERVYSRQEIAELGGDPHAALAIEAKPGYQLGSSCSGDYVGGKPHYPATHGYDPRRPELKASLVITGPTVTPRDIHGARVVDVAPTIAGWLGIDMRDVDGRDLMRDASP